MTLYRICSPAFLPNPKDGSLYILDAGSEGSSLKKLPFTIPELVAASPFKSTDGILYTGIGNISVCFYYLCAFLHNLMICLNY